jgi:hypothetical protein
MSYKIRRNTSKTGSGDGAASIAIPTEIAAVVPAGLTFDVELTPEGILYRPSAGARVPVDLPEWITGDPDAD